VIYEEKRPLDGPDRKERTRIGKIISAEFNTEGTSHYAFLFNNGGDFADYFDEEGKSLRKELLRAPLSYTRISSSFSRRRFHPILHRYAPHMGIDYAAPEGTPVMSTGDGVVLAAARKKANGNYIKIKHKNNYISYYLHLSRFANGIKQGAKVAQGQVIGYVGATGYATGPHLDYRIKKDGRFVNPRSLELPPAKPVSPEMMAAFDLLKSEQIAILQEIPVKDPRNRYYADNTEGKEDDGRLSAPPGRRVDQDRN
jgi:murein DD-endopeptidase MepM/ murein hydrolase activator NlpD